MTPPARPVNRYYGVSRDELELPAVRARNRIINDVLDTLAKEHPMTALRAGLAPLPPRMRHLPIEERGYPVPWFVQWVEGEGDDMKEMPPGQGRPDFRIMDGFKWRLAVRDKLCWTCGQRLGTLYAFLIGPMCAVNRVSGEPPSHLECAEFSAVKCPFLSRPKAQRREAGLPEGEQPIIGGIMIARNPGVALVWMTKSYKVEDDGMGGKVIRIGPPLNLEWYAEGRKATRVEILASIDSGLPLLRQVAKQDGPDAEAALERQVAEAMELVPA